MMMVMMMMPMIFCSCWLSFFVETVSVIILLLLVGNGDLGVRDEDGGSE